MKIKDIEKNLKKESESMKVPDVYTRVKRAPINKLLSDPIHAFQRRMVTGMLVIVLAIFLVVVIGVSAIWLTPENAEVEEVGYLRLQINDEAVFGFVVKESGIVLVALKEKVDGNAACEHIANVSGKSIENAINEVYHSNTDYEMVVSVQFETYSKAKTICQNVVSLLVSRGADAHARICDAATRASWAEYISLYGGDGTGELIADLVHAYELIAANA